MHPRSRRRHLANCTLRGRRSNPATAGDHPSRRALSTGVAAPAEQASRAGVGASSPSLRTPRWARMNPPTLSCAFSPEQEVPHGAAAHCLRSGPRHRGEIGQCPRNSIIAPTQIFFGHADNELLDFCIDSRPAGAATCSGTIEFLGDELSIPPQTCNRPRCIRYVPERLAAQAMSNFPKRSPLYVGESLAGVQLCFENVVVGNEIFITQQKFLVHCSGDLGQEAQPIHKHLPTRSSDDKQHCMPHRKSPTKRDGVTTWA